MRRYVVILFLFVPVMNGCLLNEPGTVDGMWMSIAPVQCMGNPWEQDWLAAHDNKYDGYPADLSKPGIEPGEQEVIIDFYRRQGVAIQSVRSTEWGGGVCAACNCPQGYTLFVLVSEVFQDKMVDLGFSPP